MGSVTMLPSGRFRGNAQVKTMRETASFKRDADALTWVAKTEARMHAGKWQKAAVVPVSDRGMTVEEALEEYKSSEEWLAKGEVTRRVELGKQKAVVAALGKLALVELKVDDVRDFIAARRKAKPQRATDPEARLSGDQIRLEVAALSSLCNYAIQRKWLSTNPTRGVKRPKGGRRTTRLTDELIGGIIQHDAIIQDPTAYLFFRILFTTVCRPGELAGAKREWLRGDPPQIQVPRTKNEDARNIILPIHVYEMLVKFIEEQPEDCPFIFGTRKLRSEGWSPYNYAVPWKKVDADLGLTEKGIVPYLARHESISRLFERTSLSDGQIAGLSGHRSSQALWHYKHLRNEHQRPIVNALDAMVVGAIDRAISHLHPSVPLKPGEMLKPIEDTKDMRKAVVFQTKGTFELSGLRPKSPAVPSTKKKSVQSKRHAR